ncbi:SpoIIE family protein phosphatase [Streptomyces europaeiscabiei]|uniref:SpoIIE family protein phosphatase n=2 Tax=Streptomyces europaeiscabiei TaxID=146819 RepID=UPI0038D3918D
MPYTDDALRPDREDLDGWKLHRPPQGSHPRRLGRHLLPDAAGPLPARPRPAPGAGMHGPVARRSPGTLPSRNAGHPWPLRLRNGQLQEITPKVDTPFGFPAPHTYRVRSPALRPGDRSVMLTDGMPERNVLSVDLSDLIVCTCDLHPREATRTLTRRSSTPTTATRRTTRPPCAWTGTAPATPGGTPPPAPASPTPPHGHGRRRLTDASATVRDGTHHSTYGAVHD